MGDYTKKEYTTYLIKEIELAYKIIDAGLLHLLCGVSPNKFGEGYVYFFNKHDDIKQIINEYRNENYN